MPYYARDHNFCSRPGAFSERKSRWKEAKNAGFTSHEWAQHAVMRRERRWHRVCHGSQVADGRVFLRAAPTTFYLGREETMSQNPIWLDDLMTRDVAVEWFESVALVQAVCKEIIEAGKEPDGFPTAADLLLQPDGSIGVMRIAAGEDAARAAARMITNLGGGPFPVQLRLALSQAAAGEPATSTLRAFSDTLRFFERPNPQDILQHLYKRVSTAPSKTQAPAQVASAPAVQDKPPTPETTKEKKKGRRRGRLAAAAAVIVVAASVSLVFFGFGGADTQIRNAMGSVRESVSEKLGLSSSGAPSEAVEKPVAAPVKARMTPTPHKSAVHAARLPAAASANRESPLTAFGFPILGGVGLAPLHRGAVDTDRVGRVDEIIYPELETPTLESEIRIYSSNDSDVLPPRPVYPQLPTPDSIRKDAAVVELLIGTDGLVERVKLRTAPRTIHDVMLLSAAKAWRFDPASIDGAPVKFLYRIAIAP